jgi:hypothetical protein
MNTIGSTQSPLVTPFVTLSVLDDEDFRVCDLINEQRASTQKQVATNPTPTLSFANTSSPPAARLPAAFFRDLVHKKHNHIRTHTIGRQSKE